MLSLGLKKKISGDGEEIVILVLLLAVAFSMILFKILMLPSAEKTDYLWDCTQYLEGKKHCFDSANHQQLDLAIQVSCYFHLSHYPKRNSYYYGITECKILILRRRML